MADQTAKNDPQGGDEQNDRETTLVERWLEDQAAWQKTAMSFFDSMVNNDEFLVNLGNAMRGSLLAGKPYPTASSGAADASETTLHDRIDQVLFALHRIQGQLNELSISIDELKARERAWRGEGTTR